MKPQPAPGSLEILSLKGSSLNLTHTPFTAENIKPCALGAVRSSRLGRTRVLSAVSAWRMGKGIYRFDPDLLQEF
jgi:hypothetical protein